MNLRILGPLEAARDGALLNLGSPRQRTFLALLLIRPGEAVSTDRLIDELWGGEPPQTARHTLQVYAYRLRKALAPEGGRLESRPPGYRLRISPGELDASSFQDLIDSGRQALGRGEAQAASSLLDQALGLWRGPVLAGVLDVVALEPERARLEGMRLAAHEDRIDADLALGRHAALVEELEGLVSEHPLRERLWGQLMVALYRSGRQADALAAYDRARRTLAEELGLDPGPDLAGLQEGILLQDPALQGLKPRTAVELPHQLPVQRTSFVGRRRELAELQGLLQARRLLTVTGPPGSGKTRLTLEVAAGSRAAFPHGVFLVSLAEVEDPGLVPFAIAAALGVSAAGRSVVHALVDHARPKRLLLVLDNFEHVLPAAPVVGELLDAAPGLRILATSRARLHLSGEQEYPLPPLPVPDAEELTPERSDAVDLFADRARAVDPRFALTTDNAPLAAEVVARLDGLPLAIELAAARLKLFPLEDLCRRLDPVLPVLTQGPVDRSLRQRTLRGAIAWSHDLLDPADRAIFRRLGVFRGGFTLEAAEAVAPGPPADDVTAGIGSLLDMSLLERPAIPGEARYTMLETIREYALERLRSSGEEQGTRRRHADFYSNLVQQAEPELTLANQSLWLRRLEAERANLRAALGWAQGRGETELGLLMAARMWRFWQFRGHLAEGRRWLEDLLAVERAAPSVPRAKALIALSGICYWQGDLDGAEARYREALDLLESPEDWWLRGEALSGLVVTLACHRGDLEAALPLEREFQALVAGHQDPMAMGVAVMTSGMMRLMAGDLDGARPYCERVLGMTRAAGERWWEGQTLRTLGHISCMQERYEQAEDQLRGSLEIAWDAGDLAGVALDLEWLGHVALAGGRAERGLTLAGAASRLRESVGAGITVQAYRWEPEHPRDGARRFLTDHDIDTAWARGRAMSLEDAVADAQGASAGRVR